MCVCVCGGGGGGGGMYVKCVFHKPNHQQCDNGATLNGKYLDTEVSTQNALRHDDSSRP